MALRDLEPIFREEETGEQIAIATLVQRLVLLSRGQVGVTAALLRWAMLPKLPGKTSCCFLKLETQIVAWQEHCDRLDQHTLLESGPECWEL